MKHEDRRNMLLATQCGQEPAMVQAMWETFCYRSSRNIGHLITAEEMEQMYPSFASAFATLVTGGLSPLDAMNGFYMMMVLIAAQEQGKETH